MKKKKAGWNKVQPSIASKSWQLRLHGPLAAIKKKKRYNYKIMKTAERLKFQKNLIKELMSWHFLEKGFSRDLKELNIYNETFLFPSYANSSRGPFFTLRPSIRINSKILKAEINEIIENPILMNCNFAFGERLNRHLGKTDIIGSNRIDLLLNKFI